MSRLLTDQHKYFARPIDPELLPSKTVGNTFQFGTAGYPTLKLFWNQKTVCGLILTVEFLYPLFYIRMYTASLLQYVLPVILDTTE